MKGRRLADFPSYFLHSPLSCTESSSCMKTRRKIHRVREYKSLFIIIGSNTLCSVRKHLINFPLTDIQCFFPSFRKCLCNFFFGKLCRVFFHPLNHPHFLLKQFFLRLLEPNQTAINLNVSLPRHKRFRCASWMKWRRRIKQWTTWEDEKIIKVKKIRIQSSWIDVSHVTSCRRLKGRSKEGCWLEERFDVFLHTDI